MAEIVNTKPSKKRKLVSYIEMGDLLYAILKKKKKAIARRGSNKNKLFPLLQSM